MRLSSLSIVCLLLFFETSFAQDQQERQIDSNSIKTQPKTKNKYIRLKMRDPSDSIKELNNPDTPDSIVYQDQKSDQPQDYSEENTEMEGINSNTINENYPGINRENSLYSAMPFPKENGHFTAFGEFLYWTSGVNDLYYAALGADDVILTRSLKSFRSHYQPGFRIGGNYSMSAQGWDFSVDFTQFKNTHHKELNYPFDGLSSFETWSSLYTVGASVNREGGGIKGVWHLFFNQVDMTLGKEVFFSKYYAVRPNTGARFVWYDDKFEVNAENTRLTEFNRAKYKNSYHGFGFKVGLDNRFLMGYGLYVLANADAGLVYGRMYIKDDTSSTTPSAIRGLLGTEITEHAQALLPFIDTRLSFGWRRGFFSDSLGLDLMIGYEYRTFINGHIAIQLPSSSSASTPNYVDIFSTENRNLFMHGMEISAKLSF